MNKSLANLYVERLLPKFGKHTRRSHDSRGLRDPWWWPAGSGTTAEQWGLDPADPTCRKAFASLRGGSSADGFRPLYEGFTGSIGCEAAKCERWVLSSRPSCGPFPSGTTGRLARILGDLGWSESTHVCDMYKFRGHGPDARADEDTSPEHWELCLDMLEEEFAITNPKTVLIAGGRTQAWIQRALEDHVVGRHGGFLKMLSRRTVRVTSWMARTTNESIKEHWLAASTA